MKPGRPTIVTVARVAGCSPTAVSQALRGVGRISEATRRRVFAAARELDYVHDRRAAAMRSGRSMDVGLLIHNIANPFNAQVTVGANAYLEERGYLPVVLDALDERERQSRYLDTLLGGASGGLLWVPAAGTDAATVEHVRSRSPATVTFLRRASDETIDHVGIADRKATRALAERLIAMGHRRFAFLGGEGASPTNEERRQGCREALADAGLEPPLALPCPETKADASAALQSILETHRAVTAVMCNCDVVALGAVLGAQRQGVALGSEISITGFDDLEDAALWTPPLTTISVDPRRLGATLAKTFLRRLDDPNAPAMVRTIEGVIRERATSGPPAARAQNRH